jgi:hypothetical protein
LPVPVGKIPQRVRTLNYRRLTHFVDTEHGRFLKSDN